MNKPVVLLPPSPHPWPWPVDVTQYDCSPHLTEAERAELKRVMKQKPFQLRPSTKMLLHRLLAPIQDVFAVTQFPTQTSRHDTMRVMVLEMYRRGQDFLDLVRREEWMEIIGSSYTAFAQRYGRRYGVGQHPARRELACSCLSPLFAC